MSAREPSESNRTRQPASDLAVGTVLQGTRRPRHAAADQTMSTTRNNGYQQHPSRNTHAVEISANKDKCIELVSHSSNADKGTSNHSPVVVRLSQTVKPSP